jgi:hypothetical protein
VSVCVIEDDVSTQMMIIYESLDILHDSVDEQDNESLMYAYDR